MANAKDVMMRAVTGFHRAVFQAGSRTVGTGCRCCS